MFELFKKIKKFNKQVKKDHLTYAEKEYPKISKVESFYIESKGITGNLCIGYRWPNGEGFDFHLCDSKGNEKRISLHDSEIDHVLQLLEKMKYFEIN